MLLKNLPAFFFALVLVAACDSAGRDGATPAAATNGGTGTSGGGSGAEPDERMIDAVKSRKAVLTVLKDNFVPLALMASGRIDYNAQAAQTYARRLPVMIGMIEERFATDTRGSGVETEALDAIWEDKDAFKGKIKNAMDAANQLTAVATDEAQFKDAAMSLRDRCGSCHDDFRVDTD